MNNDIKPISIYYDYIKSKLPDYIPDEIIKKCLSNDSYSNYVRGLNYYVYYDPGKAPAELLYVASNDEDLKHRIFLEVSYNIARQIQLLNCEKLQIHYTNFDFEKSVKEIHLNILKSYLSQGEINIKIKQYENEINQYNNIYHWKFDKEKFKFTDELANS